ncbi:hypothetical protein A2U01_0111200, partial [Trifolium medium]|nr:hypothetical protein [Trifolium medium]
MREGNYTEY